MPAVKSLMIVNMGAETVDFSILNNGIILFTRSVNTGGMVFTRAIKQELALDDIQAEEYKKTYGFQHDQLDGKTYETLQPFIGSIVTEMKKGIAFYEEKNPNSKLETVLLSGGSSLLPGLLEHLAKELNIEVQIGNPWSAISLDNKITSQINQINTTIFTVATGLALRSEK
jgi:type IV pilus assembly protein PilM